MNKDILVTISTKGFLILASLISSILTARALGVDERGQYFLLVSVSALIVQFANFGLSNGNVFYLAKSPKKLPSIVSNSIIISLGTGFACCFLVFLAIKTYGFWEVSNATDLFLGIFAAPGALLYLFLSNILIAQHNYSKFNFFEFLNKYLPLVLFLFVFLLDYKLTAFLASLLLASWIVPLLMILVIGNVKISFDFVLLKKMLPYSLLSYFACLGGYLILRASAFLGAELLSSNELGVLSLAAQLADMVNIIPASIIVVVFPYLIKGSEDVKPTVLLLAVVGLVSIVCLAAYLLLPYVVPSLFGEGFAQATDLFNRYIPAIILFSAISVFSHLIAAVRVPKTVLFVWALACIICYLITPILHSETGVYGVIDSLSLSYGIVLIGLSCIYVLKIRRRAI